MYKQSLLKHKLTLILALIIFLFANNRVLFSQGCTLANYTTATRIGPAMFPYFSAGSGITITATVFNVPTLMNFTYTCGANSFSCSDPAWWPQYSTGWIQLNFSAPIYKMTWVLNGSNTGEVFTFTPNTGTVTLSDICTGAGNFSAAGNQLTCLGSLGTIVSVNHPTGMTQLTVYHNGTGSGSRMSPLDCFVTSPLPVSLSLFDGKSEGLANKLFWETSSEINNSHFVIEKSHDAIHFEKLAEVAGAGNSNNAIGYELLDTRPYPTTYYRLKQVDFNGDFTNYGPISIVNENGSAIQVSNLYPNPASDEFTIEMTSVQPQQFEVSILDGFGRIKKFETIQVNGKVLFPVPVGDWARGVYQVYFYNQSSGEGYTKKLILQ